MQRDVVLSNHSHIKQTSISQERSEIWKTSKGQYLTFQDPFNEPNSAWLLWKEIFLSVCNHHAPLRRKRVRARPAPWLTSELKNQMFLRGRAF